jgi:nitrite reductase/ring-hydroxylating ferredoxin subunit
MMRERIRVAAVSELHDMEPICVEHRGVLYVTIKVQGELKGYVSLCAHKDLVMDPPRVAKGCLVCPHHKVTFDPTSGAVVDDRGKKVPQGLMPVELVVADGVVYLETRKKHRKLVPKRQRFKVKRKYNWLLSSV